MVRPIKLAKIRKNAIFAFLQRWFDTLANDCTLVFTGELKQINLYLPIRGHSFLPCDRVFGVIERMKRKKILCKTTMNGRT